MRAAVEFRIRQRALDAVVAEARRDSPRECCGLLVGTGLRIDEAVPARNLADGTTRFLIDPQDHIAGLRAARTRGLDVVGFYHSHPRSTAWPSPVDIAEATYPDAVQLIVSLAGGTADARLFRIDGGAAVELVLTPLA